VAAGWDELIIPEDLSFWSEDELRRVFDGFQFPALMRSKSGNEFTGEDTGEDIFLILNISTG